MKLRSFQDQNKVIKYWHDQSEVDIPEYTYRKDDVRGVWISNVANIDTPKGLPMDEYQEYLRNMIKTVASYNMNVIVFQVRPTNDAYYPSKLNPWSRFITGVEGQDPGFDVLKFVIDEAKKYQIRVHAWMNPYRVSTEQIDKLGKTKEEYLDSLAPNNFARIHKEHTVLDGVNKVALAPSHPEVIKFVTDSIMEVAENYDVEAVHIDDYFYPYAKIPEEYEEADYLKYRDSDDQSFDDFRRSNVDKMIKSVHEELKKLLSKNNKKVQFGISPFSIYRTNIAIDPEGWEKGSFHSAGVFQCYHGLYSDVYKWMKEGWIDYVVPQIYFPFERQDITYHDMTYWWSNICKETNTILYMGQGLYQMGNPEKVEWQNKDEMRNQLAFNSQFDNIKGTIFFTYRDLVKGQNEIKDYSLDTIKELWNGNK